MQHEGHSAIFKDGNHSSANLYSTISLPCKLRCCEVSKISNKLLINCLWTMWCIFISNKNNTKQLIGPIMIY